MTGKTFSGIQKDFINNMESLEHPIQKEIMIYLQKDGWLCWRNQSGVIHKAGRYIHMGIKGLPDLFALKDGKFMAIEVKRTKGNKTSKEQDVMHEELRQHGAVVFVARSVEDVKDFLDFNIMKIMFDSELG